MAYDLEKYATALEGLADWEKTPDIPITEKDDPYEYGKNIARNRAYSRGFRYACKRAAEMLRSSPSVLWTVYPDYFPDPDAKEDEVAMFASIDRSEYPKWTADIKQADVETKEDE